MNKINNMKNMINKTMETTTFFEDFTIAEHFGIKAIKETYHRAAREWVFDYKYLTELVIVLNLKTACYLLSGSRLYEVYDELWSEAAQYVENKLKGDELEYYIRKTDDFSCLKFHLGKLLMTCGVNHAMKNDKDYMDFIIYCLFRHMASDLGDLCDEDKELNNVAIKKGFRILSAYDYPENGSKIFIITEADRSYTTIMFAEEY